MSICLEKARTLHRRISNGEGRWGVVVRAFRHYEFTRAPQAAASMAYYAIFSLFPLLLLLISVASVVLASQLVRQEVVNLLTETLPVSADLVIDNLDQLLALRQPVTIVGMIALIWAATGFFNVLVHNVSLAWPDTPPRNLLERRLFALVIVVVLAILLILALVPSLLMSIFPGVVENLKNQISPYGHTMWAAVTNLLPWFFKFVLLLGLYRWVPSTRVTWSAALLGAAAAAFAWELVTMGFNWYLSSGLVRYELIYGSLGAIVVLMLWLYLSSWIVLSGAHLGATIDNLIRYDQEEQTGRRSDE